MSVARSVKTLALTALVAATTTACHKPGMPLPVFPSSKGAWVVPLLQPLQHPAPVVIARLSNAGATKHHALKMVVDTGSGRTVIPLAALKALGIAVPANARQAKLQSVDGVTEARVVVVPALRLGTLTLKNVSVLVSLNDKLQVGLLGDDILSQRELRLDLHEGVMVLGGPPPRSKGVVRSLPLKMLTLGQSPASLRIHGQTTRMMVDTGASHSAIDSAVARGWTLAQAKVDGTRLSTTSGSRKLSHLWLAKVTLGGHDFGEVRLAPLKDFPFAAQGIVGVLGMDLLGRFTIGIDRKMQRLTLRVPTPLLQSAPKRLARWSWAKRCPAAAGCIVGLLGSVGKTPKLVIAVKSSADYNRPVDLLFGFVDKNKRLLRRLPLIAVRLPSVSSKSVQALLVSNPAHLKRLVTALTAEGAAGLALLDLNPVLGPAPKRAAYGFRPALD